MKMGISKPNHGKKSGISVIVPVYQVDKWLKECVSSILAQTFEGFELILIDDGSADACPAICDDYGRMDDRVRVVHQENRGLSGARNTGLDIAEGKYIFFVDSDDVLLADRCLEILYGVAEWSDAGIVHCGMSGFQDGGKIPEWAGWDGDLALYTGAYICGQLQRIDPFPFAAAFAKLYKKELFDELRYPEGRLAEDQFLAHRLYYPCSRVVVVGTSMYGYRRRSSGIMRSSKRARLYIDVQDAFKDRTSYFQSMAEEQLADQSSTLGRYWKSWYLLGAAEDGSWQDIPDLHKNSFKEAMEMIRQYDGEQALERKLSGISIPVREKLGLVPVIT